MLSECYCSVPIIAIGLVLFRVLQLNCPLLMHQPFSFLDVLKLSVFKWMGFAPVCKTWQVLPTGTKLLDPRQKTKSIDVISLTPLYQF